MSHNRKFVIGGVSLTEARTNKFTMSVMKEVRDELEEIIVSSHFLKNAPFKWVGLVIRYGLKNELSPHYQKINDKHGDLPVGIEINTNEMIKADRDELKFIILKAALISLIHTGDKYDLPNEKFVELMSDIEV